MKQASMTERRIIVNVVLTLFESALSKKNKD
jgi:hypothetical protein